MIEALWSIEFVAHNGNFGAGVAVLETGRVFGGDSSYFYVGSYTVSAGRITGEVVVTHYSGPPNNIFGPLSQFTLHLTGPIAHDTFVVTGVSQEFPGAIAIRFTRRAELP